MGDSKKHPYEMTREELLDANELASARSTPRADNPDKEPQPDYDERVRIAEEQAKNAQNALIENLLKFFGASDKQS